MSTWQQIHAEVFAKPEMKRLKEWIQQERQSKSLLPAPSEVMNAFKLTPYDNVRWVILGQDPYPNKQDSGHGLAFSSLAEKTPASLRNIFKEIRDEMYPDYTIEEVFKTNNLTKWAEQGILLMNTVLTVEEGVSNSHQGRGWEVFTQHTMKALNNHPRALVFFLWGKSAQDWGHMITDKKHLVLSSPDPSPVSADNGFFGTYHFSAARAFSRDDYIDLRPFVDNLSTSSPMRNFLRELYKRKGIIFDESKAANLPVGIISPDIPNNTTIDLSLS